MCTYLADVGLADWWRHRWSNGLHGVVFIFGLPSLGLARRLNIAGLSDSGPMTGFLIHISLFERLGRVRCWGVGSPIGLHRAQARWRPRSTQIISLRRLRVRLLMLQYWSLRLVS